MDPFGLLMRPEGYGEKYLDLTLGDLSGGKGSLFLATNGSDMAGLVAAKVLGRAKDPGASPGIRGRITELYVEKRFRRMGAGIALMKAAEKYLKGRKCKYILIEVFAPNTAAHDFYSKLGYGTCDVEMIKKL